MSSPPPSTHSNPAIPSTKHLQAAGYSIASNIAVQLLSRGFTFILTAVTLKYLQSSSLLGIINVRIALLFSTLQFLSREPFRRACLGRAATSDQKSWGRVVNTIWLGTPLSLILAVPLTWVWQLNSPPISDLVGTNLQDYYSAIWVTCLAVIVEMLAEPCFIYAQARGLVDHNPKVEVMAVTLKCITTAAFAVAESNRYKSGDSSYILTKVAACQLLSSGVYIVHSYGRMYFKQRLPPTKFLPSLQQLPSEKQALARYFDETSLKLSLGFISQTFLKQILTEGERFVMTFFNVITLSEQGVYDVVNNLGSLTARLIFKPIEDSGYTLFSQTTSRTEILDIRRFYRVQENLMFLIRAVMMISLVVLTFGYNFVPLIVIYGGEKLNNTTAFNLMRWQLFYTPLLAVNGVSECFTFAVMDTHEIRSYNYKLVLFSVLFLVSIYVTQSALGSACFVFANCLIMMTRIFFCYRLIAKYFVRHGYELKLQETIPSLTTFISLIEVFIFLSISQHYLLDLSQPFLVLFGIILGGWCFLFIVHVIVCHEEDLIDFASRLFNSKTS